MGSERMTERDFLIRLKAELGKAYHDISNPLAIVSGNLELVHELRKAGVPPEEMLDSMEDAHKAVAGFAGPLQQLMALRRVVEERLEGLESS